MPKLLVLFRAGTPALTRVGEAVAEGARSVRFAEVDVRVLQGDDVNASSDSRSRPLESEEALASYDGLIIGALMGDERGEGETDAIALMLRRSTAQLDNKVGSVFSVAAVGSERGATPWAILGPMGDRGMILVPPRAADLGDDELDTARRQGKRIADIVGWITHARSHHHHL